MSVDLSVQLGDLSLKNPIMVASGTWGWGREYGQLLDPNLLGGLVTKAVTLHPREGNPPPRTVEVSCGMLNAIGLANVGVEAFIREKLPFLRTLDTKVIVNVAGATLEEYVEVVARLEGQAGIDALEINISCPNVRAGGMVLGTDPEVVWKLISAIRRVSGNYLIVKLSPNVSDIVAIAKGAAEAGAQAISLINTLVGMSIDVRTRRPHLSTVVGGLSGPAIKPVALALVWTVARSISLPIIGVGGIMTAEDAVEFLLAGASAVQVGTANFVDPQIPVQILHGLKEFCQRQGLGGVGELVGGLEN